MVPLSGTRSPTFQPKRLARSTPTTAPCLSAAQAFICSGGMWISGYMLKYSSGSVAMVEKKLVGSWYTPPNHVLCVTVSTPGTLRSCAWYETGSGMMMLIL